MFSSLIDTAAPLSDSEYRQITASPVAYRGYGQGADASRSAYARAMSDMGRNQGATALDQYRAAYQQQAEKARSADLMNQRQLAQASYDFDVGKARTAREQTQAYQRNLAEVKQQRKLAGSGYQASLMSGAIGGIVGNNLTHYAAPMIGQKLAGGASVGGGFGSSGQANRGLFGGLMSSGMFGR